ncbi:MAG: hypothetical protein ACE361_00270 [Aureliella sp.]
MLKTLQNVLVVALAFASGDAGRCIVCAQEENTEAFLQLDYEQFDQDMNGGWRVHAKDGKYSEAAKMIEAYLAGVKELTEGNQRMLRFHAGQMWAMGDQAEKAIKHFKKSTQSSENDFMRWNAYVNGTIAFLQKDRAKLKAAREEVAKAEVPRSFNKNLVVLDMLLDSKDASYREIFEAIIKKATKQAEASKKQAGSD